MPKLNTPTLIERATQTLEDAILSSESKTLSHEEVEQLKALSTQVRQLRDTHIRLLRANGLSTVKIGHMYKLTPARISQICALEA